MQNFYTEDYREGYKEEIFIKEADMGDVADDLSIICALPEYSKEWFLSRFSGNGTRVYAAMDGRFAVAFAVSAPVTAACFYAACAGVVDGPAGIRQSMFCSQKDSFGREYRLIVGPKARRDYEGCGLEEQLIRACMENEPEGKYCHMAFAKKEGQKLLAEAGFRLLGLEGAYDVAVTRGTAVSLSSGELGR